LGKRVFGDGERTMDDEEGDGEGEEGGALAGGGEGGRGRRSSFASLRGKEEVADEEKKALLDGYR
jgi:hypothetical protein